MYVKGLRRSSRMNTSRKYTRKIWNIYLFISSSCYTSGSAGQLWGAGSLTCIPVKTARLFYNMHEGVSCLDIWQNIYTTRQLISPHYLSSHPCHISNSFSLPAPSCSNALPKIEICQSNIYVHAVDITSLNISSHLCRSSNVPPPPSSPTTRTIS